LGVLPKRSRTRTCGSVFSYCFIWAYIGFPAGPGPPILVRTGNRRPLLVPVLPRPLLAPLLVLCRGLFRFVNLVAKMT
jgi:hypothetical protein